MRRSRNTLLREHCHFVGDTLLGPQPMKLTEQRGHVILSKLPPVALQMLVVSFVLSRLNFGNATLVVITAHLPRRLQSVRNAAVWLIVGLRSSVHVRILLAGWSIYSWLLVAKSPRASSSNWLHTWHICMFGTPPRTPVNVFTDSPIFHRAVTYDRLPAACPHGIMDRPKWLAAVDGNAFPTATGFRLQLKTFFASFISSRLYGYGVIAILVALILKNSSDESWKKCQLINKKILTKQAVQERQ